MRTQLLAALVATSLVLPACGMTVDRDDQGHNAKVDIRTPFGHLNVRTDIDAAATGLPLYPGASPIREHDGEPKSADVNIGNSYFGVKVVAAKFQHNDAPEPIVNFYKHAMQAYGDVLECRGNIDFRGGRHSRPVCKERTRSREIQLVAGTEDRHRIVVVKPRGTGSEFSAVYIETHGT